MAQQLERMKRATCTVIVQGNYTRTTLKHLLKLVSVLDWLQGASDGWSKIEAALDQIELKEKDSANE